MATINKHRYGYRYTSRQVAKSDLEVVLRSGSSFEDGKRSDYVEVDLTLKGEHVDGRMGPQRMEHVVRISGQELLDILARFRKQRNVDDVMVDYLFELRKAVTGETYIPTT